MCFSMKAPKVEIPAMKAPTREGATKGSGPDARRLTATREGIYGNIFSSILGDAGYGGSAKPGAALGTTPTQQPT